MVSDVVRASQIEVKVAGRVELATWSSSIMRSLGSRFWSLILTLFTLFILFSGRSSDAYGFSWLSFGCGGICARWTNTRELSRIRTSWRRWVGSIVSASSRNSRFFWLSYSLSLCFTSCFVFMLALMTFSI